MKLLSHGSIFIFLLLNSLGFPFFTIALDSKQIKKQIYLKIILI
jgi:hypothetical protein